MFGFGNGRAAAILSALDRSQAVIEFELDGTIITANENFLKAMGYSLAEIRGKHHSIFVAIPPTRRAPNTRNSGRVWRAANSSKAQFPRVAKGGREVWIEASYNPIVNRSGKPVKVVKFATDITATKNAAIAQDGQIAALNRSQAVIEFDLDGNILDANPNFLSTDRLSPGRNPRPPSFDVRGARLRRRPRLSRIFGTICAAASSRPASSTASARVDARCGSKRRTTRSSTRTASP